MTSDQSSPLDLSSALIPVEQLEKRRWVANVRERTRVRAMRSAYERLNSLLPHNPAEPQLTHTEIVYRALHCIRQLEKKRMDNSRHFVAEHATFPHSSQAGYPAQVYPLTCTYSSDYSLRASTSPTSCSEASYDEDNASTEGESCVLERPLFKPHRVAINSKMRLRSREMREAFECLRGIVPFDEAEPYLSQCNLIRRASQYIRYLSRVLDSTADGEKTKASFC